MATVGIDRVEAFRVAASFLRSLAYNSAADVLCDTADEIEMNGRPKTGWFWSHELGQYVEASMTALDPVTGEIRKGG